MGKVSIKKTKSKPKINPKSKKEKIIIQSLIEQEKIEQLYDKISSLK